MRIMYWVSFDCSGDKNKVVEQFEKATGLMIDGTGSKLKTYQYDLSGTCHVNRIVDITLYCFSNIPGSEITIYKEEPE